MNNFVVVGKDERIVTAVLQALYCFSQASSMVMGSEATYRMSRSSLCARHIYIDFSGTSEHRAITALNQLHAETPHLTIIPADRHGIRLISRIKQHLRTRIIPVPDSGMLTQLEDKWHFHELCVSHAISVPETCHVGSKVNLNFDELVRKLGLPFVLKPTDESGSRGVQLITSKEHYLKAVRNNTAYQFKSLLAQRYINGEDLDICVLAVHGQIEAIAVYRELNGELEFIQNEQLEAAVRKLCQASSFHGVLHLDARIERRTGQVFLIEANPGFRRTLAASIWCGLNLVEESIKAGTGPRQTRRLTCGSASLAHPLLRPSAWSKLLDADPRGRLTRAAMLDAYALGQLARELPTSCLRRISQHFSPDMHAVKSNYGMR